LNIKNIKKSRYVKNNHNTCLNYYNEIENYIKDNSKIPLRLKSDKKAKRKTQTKRLGKFRKMVKYLSR